MIKIKTNEIEGIKDSKPVRFTVTKTKKTGKGLIDREEGRLNIVEFTIFPGERIYATDKTVRIFDAWHRIVCEDYAHFLEDVYTNYLEYGKLYESQWEKIDKLSNGKYSFLTNLPVYNAVDRFFDRTLKEYSKLGMWSGHVDLVRDMAKEFREDTIKGFGFTESSREVLAEKIIWHYKKQYREGLIGVAKSVGESELESAKTSYYSSGWVPLTASSIAIQPKLSEWLYGELEVKGYEGVYASVISYIKDCLPYSFALEYFEP